MIRLLLVDDDPLVLAALGRYFDSAADMAVVATAESGVTALDRLREQAVDAIIADIHMPEMDGPTLLREVATAEDLPHRPVFIAMTAMDSDETMVDVLAHGAAAYLVKSSKASFIIETVRQAVGGGTVVSAQSLTRLVGYRPPAPAPAPARPTPRPVRLTPGEQRILELLCEGLSNAEIAARTSYAPSTVKKLVSRLIGMFGASSRLDLAVKALKSGLVS